ncbi:Response regulator receiver domain-containing protein [Pseudarcicella hirudinis]|uniref:Response regulator receiver domain-containing protein n=1 Tax=Pseudarcicella hirudinis TaxID=1079859 RepID=A0A1I5XEG0_9BACT|nr:response regulator [Pseudarcicella hirudinis]SFQ30284.1 Response regulator receiver domain-containing protein [Pseudarcicella hirudinis]
MKNHSSISILVADDDPDDRQMTKEALEENFLLNELHFVEDGQQLMDYLRKQGRFADASINAPRPGLILLDLNMPKKDGRECLKEIKSDPDLRSIPIIILTTSKAEEDIIKTYDLGVNCFVTKPVTFTELISVTRSIGQYWFEIVKLPNPNHE